MKRYVVNKEKLDISAKFVNGTQQLNSKTIVDFWQWAYSDLLQNTIRGVLAEYIVSVILDLDEAPKIPWASYDLKLANGKKIEIKTMSRLQAWAQKELSVPRVVISPKRSWDPKTGIMEKVPSLNADYYVICYFKAEKHSTANCLDLTQWEFYVLNRDSVKAILKQTKSISLKTLRRLGFKPLTANELSEKFHQID